MFQLFCRSTRSLCPGIETQDQRQTNAGRARQGGIDLRPTFIIVTQSQRDCILQPAVTRNEQPSVMGCDNSLRRRTLWSVERRSCRLLRSVSRMKLESPDVVSYNKVRRVAGSGTKDDATAFRIEKA